MEKNNKFVVGIGEVLWDVLPEGKKLGGAPANFAYHVSQFGLNSRVVSAIGNDKLGAEIERDFLKKVSKVLLRRWLILPEPCRCL